MKKERGCARNHWMRGGGTATFTSPAGIVQPGFYPEVKTIDTCSVARPGMIQMTPKGLMGGSRRKRASRRHRSRKMRTRKMRGGMYKLDLIGQAMQPNQYAEIVRIPGESCRQSGGAPFIEMPSVGYANKPELVTVEGGNVVPVMTQQPYNNTNALSSSCKQTGGRKRRHSKRVKRTKKTKRSRRNKH
jgi:hypothetical protein